MLPQVIVLIAGGAVISPLIKRIGLANAARLSALTVVTGLTTYTVFGRTGYPCVAIALVLVAAGMRIIGVVAGNNVMRGLPADRTTIGAALVDTASELTTAIGIAVSGTIIATVFTGSITAIAWNGTQTEQFHLADTIASAAITVFAGLLVTLGMLRARRSPTEVAAPAALL